MSTTRSGCCSCSVSLSWSVDGGESGLRRRSGSGGCSCSEGEVGGGG